MTTTAFPTTFALERELDRRRDVAGEAYVDQGDDAFDGALLGDLCLLVAAADREQRRCVVTIAELGAMQRAGYMTPTPADRPSLLTAAGAEAAAAALIARQEA